MQNYINMTLTEKQQKYGINRELAKISAPSCRKVNKYEYRTGKEILVIEQAKFTFSPLGKALEKQTKTIEDEGKNKQKRLRIKEKNKGT